MSASDVESLKLLLIGNSSTGKSSLLLRFINDTFAPEDTQATIGVDFKTKLINFRGKKVRLQLWDTAGQERYRTLTSSYYRGCQGVLIVFDVTSRSSFDQLPHWFQELHSHTPQNVVIMVIGNKTDSPARQVSAEEAEVQSTKLGADAYFETSAKDNTNVRAMFVELTDRVLRLRQRIRVEHAETVKLQEPAMTQSGCSC